MSTEKDIAVITYEAVDDPFGCVAGSALSIGKDITVFHPGSYNTRKARNRSQV